MYFGLPRTSVIRNPPATAGFLLGESHGRRSLAGSYLGRRKESDTTERLNHTDRTTCLTVLPGSDGGGGGAERTVERSCSQMRQDLFHAAASSARSSPRGWEAALCALPRSSPAG